jgi:hypothetical protein
MTAQFARIPARAAGIRALSARDLRVFIAISSHADGEGRAFPSMTRIATLTGVDRCKVPASIKRLVNAGLLSARHRRDESGDFASTVYQVTFEADEVLPNPATPVAGVGNTVLPVLGTRGVAEFGNVTDHLFNRPSNTDGRRLLRKPRDMRTPSDQIAEQFEHFWRVYPSRGGEPNPEKPAREKFAAAVKRGVDPELLIRAAANYAEAMRRSGTAGRYIKTAEVWLNKASWEQYGDPIEPEPLRAGMI